MENVKNKNIIIGLLVIIIIILTILLVLFATDTISFNSNNSNNEINNLQDEKSLSIGYYQEIINYAPDAYVIKEFKLNDDNTVSYIIGGSNNENHINSGVIMDYTGTYLEKDNKIILSITSTDSNCEDGKYACMDIITLSKQNDGTLVGSDTLTETYSKVEELLFIK